VAISRAYLARSRHSDCTGPVIVHVRHPVWYLLYVVDLQGWPVFDDDVVCRRHGALSHVLTYQEEVLPDRQHPDTSLTLLCWAYGMANSLTVRASDPRSVSCGLNTSRSTLCVNSEQVVNTQVLLSTSSTCWVISSGPISFDDKTRSICSLFYTKICSPKAECSAAKEL